MLRKYPIDVIKSAVHKYLRRNNKDMFMRSMLEFYLICKDNNDFNPLITRIKIMCGEEILFIHCNEIIEIHNKLDIFSTSKNNDYKYIIDCANILSSCRRTRLSKYLLGYYGLGMDYKLCTLEEVKLEPLKAPLRKENDSDDLMDVVNKFYTLFKAGKYDCLFYALKTFYKFGSANKRFGNKRKAMYFIWEILFYEIDKLKEYKYKDNLYKYFLIL